MNKHLTNGVMASILQGRAITDIRGIARNWGVMNVEIEFDSIKTFFITIPYSNDSTQTTSYHPDFIKDLVNNGYDIKMTHSDKIKGHRMYGVVKKGL